MQTESSKPPTRSIRPVSWLKKKAPAPFKGNAGSALEVLARFVVMVLYCLFRISMWLFEFTVALLKRATEHLMERIEEASIQKDGVEGAAKTDDDSTGSE